MRNIDTIGSTRVERLSVGVDVASSRSSRRARATRRRWTSSRVCASRRDDEEGVVDSVVGRSLKDDAARERTGDAKKTATRSTLDALGAVLERDTGGKARGGMGEGGAVLDSRGREDRTRVESVETTASREETEAKKRERVKAEMDRRRSTPEGVTGWWKPYWSPLSTVYNVPTVEPRAAYFLAALHAFAFFGDLAMLKAGVSNGGEVFIRTALFDNAVVYESQWTRAFTASFVDFGLVHFALVNTGLLTVGAEAEAILGTSPFLTIYLLSAAMGGIGSMSLEPGALTVTSSDGLMGVFGALLLYSAMNIENEWNQRGFTVRLLYCAVFATGLQYIASLPSEDGTHVVNSVGHLWGFLAGGAMGYAGLSPLLSSKKFEKPDSDRKNLEDVHGGQRKVFVALGSTSVTIVALCVVVLLKRTLDIDPRDVF